MHAGRGLLPPLLAMAALIGTIDLVATYWPSDAGHRPHKIDIAHARHRPEPITPAPQTAPPAVASASKKAEPVDDDMDPAEEQDQTESSAQGKWTTRFDQYFRKYTKHCFGVGFDWRWFKAQAIVESTLKPKARSSAGAVGLMQIKPRTFGDIRKRHPEIVELHSPRWNIAAGITHMAYIYNKPAIRIYPDHARLYLSFASYNSGYSRMLRVIRAAPPETVGWRATLQQAPDESRNYVERIIKVKADTQA
ncbi:MAG: transglycosylase SLT domain-containing protein [Stenotrophobium sp.]